VGTTIFQALGKALPSLILSMSRVDSFPDTAYPGITKILGIKWNLADYADFGYSIVYSHSNFVL